MTRLNKKEEIAREAWVVNAWLDQKEDEWPCPGCVTGYCAKIICGQWEVLEQTWAMWKGLA